MLTDIVTGSREADDDEEFRLFKKQLYHASLAKIFEPLRQGMTKVDLNGTGDIIDGVDDKV